MRTCTICTSPDRASIETDILNSVANRIISSRHNVSVPALQRHRKNHMDVEAAKILPTPEVPAEIAVKLQETSNRAATVVVRLHDHQDRLEQLLEQIPDNNHMERLNVMKEIRATIGDIIKLGIQQAEMAERRELGEISPELKAMIDRVNE